MGTVLHDLRFAACILHKSLDFTVIAVFTLAIDIAANTAMFSLIDAVLLRPLLYPEPDRLAILRQRSPGIGIPQGRLSPELYDDIKTQNRVFDKTVTDRIEWRNAAQQTLSSFAAPLHSTPEAVPAMSSALDFRLAETKQILIGGDARSHDTREL